MATIIPDYSLDVAEVASDNNVGMSLSSRFPTLAATLNSKNIDVNTLNLNFDLIFSKYSNDESGQLTVANQIINNVNPLDGTLLNPVMNTAANVVPSYEYDPTPNPKISNTSALYLNFGLELLSSYLTQGPAGVIQNLILLAGSRTQTPKY